MGPTRGTQVHLSIIFRLLPECQRSPAPPRVCPGIRWDESAPRSHRLSFHEGPQPLAPAGVAQLPKRLRLDLADPLPGHLEVLAHLLQGMVGFLADPEPHPENPLLARREASKNLVHLLRE